MYIYHETQRPFALKAFFKTQKKKMTEYLKYEKFVAKDRKSSPNEIKKFDRCK